MGWAFWALLGGLGTAMGVLMACRSHWFALLDAMHRCAPDVLRALDWPREHPFDVPDPANLDPAARKFPVRRLRVRVMLFGLPHPARCPPAARRHARAYRAWGALLLAGLLGLAVVMVSPVVLILAAGLLALEYSLTARWPKQEVP